MKTFVKDGKTYAKRSDLKPWEKNPRDIKPEKLQQLVDDIKRAMEFVPDGQVKPVLINNVGTVIGGNMRMRAFEELKPECDKYGIIVEPQNNLIEYQGSVRILKDYTPSRLCKAIIRQYIKKAKAEEQAKLLENQITLFGDQ